MNAPLSQNSPLGKKVVAVRSRRRQRALSARTPRRNYFFSRQRASVCLVHADHLNTPRLATNAQGQVVWRWEGTAFGDTQPTGTVTVNLRFPGQYYDSESGLHYNWNRYYDPKLDRYVTSDPIGIDGGLNTYLYANANPLRFTDPLGLFVPGPRPPIPPIDLGICGSSAFQRLLLPDLGFGDACGQHDKCYDCRSGRSKKSCDDEFCESVKKSCQRYSSRFGREGCESHARAFCQAVRDYGQGAFDKARRECCNK